ncbi:MAG: YdbH domain-containing protein [Alphaproteobacteria bacterium]|nr:YdbH domain-containing protein [Alphaproteobacteria bacterium]
MTSDNNDSEPGVKSPDRKPRKRGVLRWVGAFCIIVIIGVAAALYWRVALANTVFDFALERAGIHKAVARVTALSTSRIHFSEIRLGNAIDVKDVDAVFDLSLLPQLAVTRVTVASLRADMADARRELAKLATNGTNDTPPTTIRALLTQAAELPEITVQTISLRHVLPGGIVTVNGSANATRRDNAAFEFRVGVALSGDIDGQTRTARIDGTARLAADAVTVDISAQMKDSGLAGTLEARGDMSSDPAILSGKIHLETADLGKLAAILPGLGNTGGSAAINARTTSPLAFGLDTPLDLTALTAALRKAGGDGVRVETRIQDGSHGALYRGVDGTVTAVLRGLPGADGRLQADGNLSLRARRAGTADVTVKNASLGGTYRLLREENALTVYFPEGLRAAAAQVSTKDGAVSVTPVKILLNAEHIRIPAAVPGEPRRVDARLRLNAGAMRLEVAGQPDGKSISIAPLALRLSGTADERGSVEARIQAPRVSVTEKTKMGVIDGLDIALRQTSGGLTGKLSGQVSAQDIGKPLLLPTPLDSTLSIKQQTVSFDAKATLPGANTATAKGRHNLSTGRGSAVLAVPAFRMTPGGGEFRALAPSISGSASASGIDIQSGTVSADARLVWNKKSIDATGTVAIENINFADPSSGTSVEGLTANIRLDQIIPPRTPAGQTIRIKRIGAGVALNDLLLRFALIEGTTAAIPAVQIDTFRTAFAGGILSIAPTVLDSEAGASQATIKVERVDLAALLSAVGLENISGTGRLSGIIPVSTAGAAVGITGGRLATSEPGVLRIRSEAAKRALAQGGKEVTLMLSALEDFRYETLTLEIEKETAGEGCVILRTRGQNPAVRDGQPFVINLTLSGNVDGLAAVLAQALELPGGIVRTMLAR